MSARASLLPGAALAACVAAAAAPAGYLSGDARVVAIVLGMLARFAWRPRARWEPGLAFAERRVLEVAIVLLGASVDLQLLLRPGSDLLLAIAVVAAAGLAGGYALSRALGLGPRQSTLIAVGGAICGDAAVAAVAPVIGADGEDVASCTEYARVLGVAAALAFPLLGLSPYAHGALAGMTLYGVPHVLAAAFPSGALSGEVGTLVKLIRVLLLGPVVVFLTLRHGKVGKQRLSPAAFVPWFIPGFLLLAAAASLRLIPAGVAQALRDLSYWLTLAALAALGLRTNVRVLARMSACVAIAVTGTLAIILAVGAVVIGVLGIG